MNNLLVEFYRISKICSFICIIIYMQPSVYLGRVKVPPSVLSDWLELFLRDKSVIK